MTKYRNDAEAEKRYNPAECIGCERKTVTGYPDLADISTGYVEQANFSCGWGCDATPD